MKSDKVILVAGGDLRQQYAAQLLRQKTGAAVWTVGLPAQPNLHFAETPAEVPAYDVLVLPVLAGSSGGKPCRLHSEHLPCRCPNWRHRENRRHWSPAAVAPAWHIGSRLPA